MKIAFNNQSSVFSVRYAETQSLLECGAVGSRPLYPAYLATSAPPKSARGLAQSKTSRSLFAVFIFALVFTLALSSHAQSFTNDWFTIGGGGGTSTGGVYSATSTIGQPTATTSAGGGRYSADNGFWGLVAVVQTPGEPLLTVSQSGTNAVISWASSFIGFVLERNSDLNNSNGWANAELPIVVSNGRNTVTVPIAGYCFYRLKR